MSQQRKIDTPANELPPPPASTVHEHDNSVTGLLRQLTREVPMLFTKELALLKAEFSESLQATKAGLASVAVGGAVALAGFIVVLMAAVYGLSLVMQPWLAALIVGAVVTVIGLSMVSAGKKKFEASSLRPSHTMNTLHKDKEAIKRHGS
ncbi:phage holin family protein [Azomonas macrocytogenes]|uniref:Phage holin family protein n=1 Tax=Azomonas macrocytogenes TaxID=69962 RepID=A0A839SWE6_AZOMA|nr:phage holin family protein [Azomonas macrocytogenes]MBB3101717.1 hypothetical protein [Azomonas macrocytogenes]